MTTTGASAVSAAELRRRVRQNEALQAKVRELAAASVLTTRQAAAEAALAKEQADIAVREAAAATLRLFGNDAELVSGLLGVPAEELEREAKPVTAARAKEVIASLRARAARPRSRRSRTAPPPATTMEDAAPAPTEASAGAELHDGRPDVA